MWADWAFIFDVLSILEVKNERLGNQADQINDFRANLVAQLGYGKYWEVRESVEYHMVFAANLALFDGVEKVRHGDGMGVKDFDDLNQARHRAKQALQKRFWGNELTETKT